MSATATKTTVTDSATDARKADALAARTLLSVLIHTLTPKKHGGDASAVERKNARVVVMVELAAILTSQPAPMAQFSIVLSDESALPFKVWASRIMSVDVGGKAYAVAAR